VVAEVVVVRLLRYRVLRPLMVHGRIAGVSEIIRLPEYAAAEYVESGHLREIDVMVEVNGVDHGQWINPTTR